jgi:hypothetical protein
MFKGKEVLINDGARDEKVAKVLDVGATLVQHDGQVVRRRPIL